MFGQISGILVRRNRKVCMVIFFTKQYMMIRDSFLFILLPAFIFFTLNSCAQIMKPPPSPRLEKLDVEQVASLTWEDDLIFERLEQAIGQSISYFEKLSSDEQFRYGTLDYSPGEMINSLRLFLKTVRQFKGRELERELREKFLFFESVNAEGRSFFTGYFEPEIDGRHESTAGFETPVYETPEDLVEVDLGRFRQEWAGEKIIGRLEKNQLIPYDTRSEIVYETSLNSRARPLAYVNDIELFFLQIQGSGIIRFPDGSLKRVNYAQQNGHPYRAIGKLLKDRIPEEDMSLQAIKSYLYKHPQEVRGILSYNPSYVFFREVEGGPFGDINVPLTPGRSIAMDRKIIPRGGLAYIETEIPLFFHMKKTGSIPLKRFMLVQDSGGAIRHHGRVDIFFGSGGDASLTAGYLKQRGRVFLIVARKEFIE